MLKQKFSWTDQNRARVFDMWKEGYSISDIGTALGVYRGAVSGLMSRNRDMFPKHGGQGKPALVHIPSRKAPRVDWTAALIEKAEAMWTEGSTAAQIAEACGATVHSLNSLVIRMRERFPKRGYVLQARALTYTKATMANADGTSQSISKSNARRKAAKDNQERIAAGLPPVSHHKLVTDFSIFALPGVEPSTLLKVKDNQCKWPISSNEDPTDGDMPVCGGRRTHGSYCTHHARIAFPPRARA